MKDLQSLQTSFNQIFGDDGASPRAFFCPGRVNLIGEHIDYNGGYVMPAALTLGITGLIRPRADMQLRVHSLNSKSHETHNISLAGAPVASHEQYGWANYPLGVLVHLIAEGYNVSHGYDILYYGNLPQGAGLSSSAAIEVLTGYMVRTLMGETDIDRTELARFAQRVENQFIKVNCGIMDQFAVANGRASNAMLLNCETLECKYVSLNLVEHSVVIMDTHKHRELASSKYNERRGECATALAAINQKYSHAELVQCNEDEVQDCLKDEVLVKRARHVITENARVLKAAEVLEKGDIKAFGKLMTESHTSLRDDYEVSCHELDVMVEASLAFASCLGARMTGAGFGGCAIAIVPTDDIGLFEEYVGNAYKEATGITPSFYVSDVGHGVHEYHPDAR